MGGVLHFSKYKPYTDNSPQVSFEYLIVYEDMLAKPHQLALVSGLLKVISPFITPYVVQVIVDNFDKNFLNYDRDILPPRPNLYFKSSRTPGIIKTDESIKEALLIDEDAIGPDSLVENLKKAVAQECAAPDSHFLSWHYLGFIASRAKLFDQSIVDSRCDSSKTVLETRGDSLWAAGPVEDSDDFPPIMFEVTKDSFIIRVDITIGWNFWLLENSREKQELLKVLEEVRQLGWIYVDIDESLSADLGTPEDYKEWHEHYS